MAKSLSIALIVCGCLSGLPAASAAAAQQPVAEWSFDEGAGNVVADSGPHGLTGAFVAGAAPAWIAGVDGSALRFDGGDAVALPDSKALEPDRLTVAAWVRRAGTPGRFQYVFSKGASSCVRSSYGLYTGADGGAVFYVAGDGRFTLSPAAPPAAVWDGRWHRLAGSYDGSRVRLYLDGAQIGSGTPAPTHIEYGVASHAPFIGTYRGECDLPFDGDIDDVAVFGTGLSAAQAMDDAFPPAETPATGPIGKTPGSAPVLPVAKGKSTTPAGCTSVTVSRRAVRVKHRAKIVVTVRKGDKRVARTRVVLRAQHLRKVMRTNAKGRASFIVRATRNHKRLRFAVAAHRSAKCGTPVAYVQVRGRR
jgi:hypothetical protein